MKKVLIIDDDPGIQEAVQFIFSSEEYEVVIYTNGNAVLNGDSIVPDIYIIDKQLAGIDGIDICKYLKGSDQTLNVPVIIMSASPNIHDLAKLAGADGTLEKPFSINVLRSMVESYLNS